MTKCIDFHDKNSKRIKIDDGEGGGGVIKRRTMETVLSQNQYILKISFLYGLYG